MLNRIVLVLSLVVLCCLPAAAADFTDNGDGTVSDNETGLMWQQRDDGTERNWQEALDYCNCLSLAGHNDWRLPNIKELESIVDITRYNPAIDGVYFSATQSSNYWSATSYAYNFTDAACCVHFGNGYVSYYYKSGRYYVRCVR